jgi:hypothetical protein
MRRTACFTAAVLAVFALTGSNLRAQDSSDGGDKEHDDKTPKNYLTFTMGYVGTAVSKKQDNNFPKETTVVFADRFSGTIEVRPERSKGGITWYPRGDSLSIEGTISETFTTRSGLMGEGEVRATETSVTAYTGYPACEANLVNALVKIRPEEKLYDLQFTLMPDMAATMESVLESKEHDIVGAPSLGGEREKKPVPPQVVPLDMGPNQMSLGISNYNLVVDVKGEPLSGDASKLTGTKRILVPRPAGWNGSWDIAMEVTWTIDVSLPPVELVITAPGYAQWRPEASIGKPHEPGNDLTAKATLKSKVGNVKYLPEVKHIRFQLLDTSREPGVCMNWPLQAKDDDYDLRLAVVAGGTLSKKEQVLEVKEPKRNDEGQPYAEVRIDSFDFGGRASLRAVCLLEDGREIEGVMKGEGGGQDMVRLPRMKSPGWIADSWRKKHNAQKLADDADDEEVKEQKENGDGYTLYEEYRGWVVNRKHLEGDPAKKDFFVLNLVGGDADPGIDLFEQLSQLRVHAKLQRNEMSAKTRLMNGNHRDAPQNKPQHGVWVKTFASRSALGDDGAMTVMNQKGVAGRPGLVDGIGILARDNTESAFNKPFNLAAGDAIFAYDRAIAHELLHSVGAEHHGTGDYNMIVGYASTRNPLNKIGRPYYGTSPDKPIDLRTEEGEDVARRDLPKYEEFRKFADMAMQDRALKEGAEYLNRNGVGYNGFHTPQDFADAQIEIIIIYCFMHLNGVVGAEHGEHSGAEDCLMRYYFAKYYESKKPASMGNKMYYLIEPGTERIGMEICHDHKGTGVNAAGHRPQSRYGDTAAAAGNCFEQICPNDAIPPRVTK